MPTLRNRLLTRVSAPATEPLTLAEAKLFLRVDHDEEDALISDLIVSARMHAEHWLKRSLITQTWKLAYDDYLPDVVFLPMGPVVGISSIVIAGRDGSTQTADSDSYYLNAAKEALVLDNLLIGFRIEVTYATGYGGASAVPTPIKQGMLEHMAVLYDKRGVVEAALPDQAIRLYMPFREIRL